MTRPETGLVLHWPEKEFTVASPDPIARWPDQCAHEANAWNLKPRPVTTPVVCDEVISAPSFLFSFYYFFGGSNYFHIHIDTLVPLFHVLRTRGLLDSQNPSVKPLLIPAQLKDPSRGGGPDFSTTSNDPQFHNSESKFGYPYWNEAFQMLTSNPLRPLHHRNWCGPIDPAKLPPRGAPATRSEPVNVDRKWTTCFGSSVTIGVSSYNPRVIPADEVKQLIQLIKSQSFKQFMEWRAAPPPPPVIPPATGAVVSGSESSTPAVVKPPGPYSLPIEEFTLDPAGPRTARVGIIARNGRRKILNEVELLKAIDPAVCDTVLVRFENMPFYRQVVLAHQLTVLVGVNGAGLMNGIYLPPDAVSIQLAPYKTDLNVHEFGEFLKVRGPYLEWWNTHPNNSFELGSSSNTNTYVHVQEFVDVISKSMALGVNTRLPKHAASPSGAGLLPLPNPPAGANAAPPQSTPPQPPSPLPAVTPSPSVAVAPLTTHGSYPYRSRLKPRSALSSPKGQTVVVNVLVPHYNRTGFLTDMLRNLTLTGDTEFVVRLVSTCMFPSSYLSPRCTDFFAFRAFIGS